MTRSSVSLDFTKAALSIGAYLDALELIMRTLTHSNLEMVIVHARI